MKTFRCNSHGIVLQIDGNKKNFTTPPGSWAGLPNCVLLTQKDPQAGTYNQCEIKEE